MTASPILTRYSAQGAVPGPSSADDSQTSVAWHYGDPLGEQRTASRGAIIVDRSDRAVIELPGDERLSWLHTISSQHVADLADRSSAENLSLDSNGRVEEHFILTDVDGVTWVDTEADRGAPLLNFLTKMVFWAKVSPGARPDMKVLTLVGPDVLHGPIAELLELPEHPAIYAAGDLPERHHEEEPLGFWRMMPPIGEGAALPVVDLVIPEESVAAWWTQLTDAGARMAGTWAYDAQRVAALRPRLGVDTDDRTIPHEVNWIGTPAELGAVHLEKGCYRGQETVARVHNLGKAPRRLVLLHLDGSTDERPAPGDPVTAGGRTVGRVGTVVDHFELGPIALALVKRSVGADVALVVDGEHPVSAQIDPDSIPTDDRVQAGRAAVERLRQGPGAGA
ncbi:folate-binding protein [Gordonia sp. CPCC 205515]|uniref:CAF17-like 4Fe-4S cluster assembly/insertion protein YgfZ n=1 Tax=Gordonia sp. CPCC 205515 TaxID=3140791 RepID=UPI003AF34A04